ncbi:MAG: hypothetical protein ACUZ8E_03060 [Candidatus Anammoxibacter sp.]
MRKLLFILLLLPLFAYPQAEKRHRSIIIDSLKALNGGIIDIKDSASFEKPVGIGGTLDASALLTLTNTAQGFLVPRMTATQRNNIVSPATGLLVFDTDSNAFLFFDSSVWMKLVMDDGGVGDMLKSAYDNNNDSIVNNSDSLDSQPPSFYLARTNHTGTQTASTISDFQTTVTANSDVTTNTAKVTNATHTGDVTGATALTIANKAVEIVMLDDGTDGELITWDASGVSATVSTGTSGQILTSNGVGTSPTFEDAAGGNTIYSADDNLAGNRVVTMGANSLTFSGNLTIFKGVDATSSNFVADFEDNANNKLLRIRNDGNVGIGLDVPVQKLHIEGAPGSPATSGTTQNGLFRITNTTNNVSLDFGQLGAPPNTSWIQNTNKANLSIEDALSLNPNGGNVGIGLINPDAILDVKGGSGTDKILRLQNSGGLDAVIVEASGNTFLAPTVLGAKIRVNTANVSSGFSMEIKGIGNGGEVLRLYRNVSGLANGMFFDLGLLNTVNVPTTYVRLNAVIGANSGDNVEATKNGIFLVSTATNGSLTEKMRIDEDGNVGIGQASASAKLAVNGSVVSNTYNFAADAQADDDYEIDIPDLAALTTGLMVTFTANTANTDGATLEITSIGDLDAILKRHDQALVTGDIEAGQVVVCVFDGSSWQMISQLAQ